MFRDFVTRKAKKMNLVGEVENLKDGTVFVVAEGEYKELQELLLLLRKGPLGSRVDKVKEEWLDCKDEFNDFNMIYYARR